MTGSEYLAAFLKEKGVTAVFDYPGNCLLPVYPALNGAGIRHYTMRSESGAIFAASGVSRAGKGLGVSFATSGPGATNLVTGLADAMLDSIPLIAFTGQVSTAVIGQDAFQEADLLGITLPITKHNFLVKDVSALPAVLEEAFAIAQSGRPGPVLVDLPQDVLLASIDPATPASARLPHRRTSRADGFSAQKDAFLSLFSRAKKPLLLVGGGCVYDAAPVREFVKTYQIPCVHTLMGKGVLPDTDPLSYGLVGLHGNAQANALFKECDTLIAVGCRFSDRTLPDASLLRGKCVLQIDLDRAELSKRFPPALGIRASANEFFSALNAEDPKPFAPWARAKKSAQYSAFSLSYALHKLSESYPDAIFITDVGTHQVLAANAVNVVSPFDFLSSGGLGAMGFGLGAALGAAIAHKDRKVILLVGDGGLQMNLGELASITEFSLDNLLLVLCDNGALGLVEELNRLQGREAIYPARRNPDFETLFAAFHLTPVRADSAESLKTALNTLSDKRANVLHLSVSSAESAYKNEEKNL